MKYLFYTLLSAFVLVGCSTTHQRYAAPESRQESRYADNSEPITQSLFSDKNATISEENIQKILDGDFKLPQQLRVAIVKVDNTQGRRYYWNDEEYLKTQQSYLDLFTSKLMQSQRVIAVSTIPDLLLTKPQSFTTIREAAVRLQADVVIVYSITTDIYSKYKVFTKPDIKAFATTQLILLDVRTGLVPFSTIVTKDQLSKKQENEMDNSEATNRIQKEAVLMTIEEIGNKLIEFLNKK
jgi:PBP1b-binding outer membrane lipoprotein LpoB